MRRALCTLGIMFFAAAAVPALAQAAAIPPGSTQLVDRPPGFGPLPFDGVDDSTITTHALSADGRFVAFTSKSDLLLSGDEDSATNVYRLDRSNGSLVQVDTTSTGGQPEPASFSQDASISADGRYVEFTSTAQNLVAGAPREGIYVKDLQTGALVLASRATGSGGAPVPAALAVISGDGRHVAFTAEGPLHADNADGVHGQLDAYVRSLDAGTTHMVSVTSAGTEAGGVDDREAPDIDFRGDAVAFLTTAQIDPTDESGDEDAYVRTGIGATERTLLASFSTGQTSAGRAEQLALSGDGTLVAWNNGFEEIYMARLAGTTVGPATYMNAMLFGGASATAPAFEPVPNATSTPARLNFLAFNPQDPARFGDTDLYGAETAHPGDAQFIHLETSGTEAGPVEAGAATANGSVVVFDSAATNLPGADGVRPQVYLHAGATDANLSQPSGVAPRTSSAGDAFTGPLHSITDDGRKIVFAGFAPAFGSVPATDRPHSFTGEAVVRDLVTGQTTLLSAAPNGAPGNGDTFGVSIDGGGDRAAFLSNATNLVAGATGSHAYVRDLATGATKLVDRTSAGAPLSRGVDEVQISGDGTHVVYESRSPDAPGAPANDPNDHVYVVDLATGNTVLADRSSAGAVADQASFGIDINGDGSRVAFESAASNLGAGNPAGKDQVYVRDLLTQTTTWASVPADGNPQHADADAPSLSRSGTVVAFAQFDAGFGHGMTGSGQVFVRDLGAGSTDLASVDSAGRPVGNFAFTPMLSADGTHLGFTAGNASASDGSVAPDGAQAYVRDLAARTTALQSVARDGRTPARLGAGASGLDAHGDEVVLVSSSDDLVTPSYGPDFEHVFVRGVGAPTTGGPGPGPGPGPGGPGTGKPPTAPPRIIGAHLTVRRFAAGAGHHHGTAFVFTLTANATISITITRHVEGRRSGKRCVAPRRGLKRRCTRTVTIGGPITTRAKAGRDRIAFSGRVHGHNLPPGTYQAVLVARDARGGKSRPVTLSFVVVRG